MASKKALEAAAATSGMFTEAEKPKRGRKTKTVFEQAQEEAKNTPKVKVKLVDEQAAPIAEPKRDLQTFSVKIDSEVLKKWRYYTTIEKYGETGKLTEAALSEYMNRHKLTQEQQAKFDTLMGL